jgi:hypothetical protein
LHRWAGVGRGWWAGGGRAPHAHRRGEHLRDGGGVWGAGEPRHPDAHHPGRAAAALPAAHARRDGAGDGGGARARHQGVLGSAARRRGGGARAPRDPRHSEVGVRAQDARQHDRLSDQVCLYCVHLRFDTFLFSNSIIA